MINRPKDGNIVNIVFVNGSIYGIVLGMKKFLVIITLIIAIVMIGLVVLSKSYVTKNFLAEKVEKSINSRLQIGEVSVSVFGNVKLENVIIHQRDELAEGKVPHDDRELLEDGLLRFDSVTFKLSMLELISRKLSIASVTADGVTAKVNMFEDGSLDIEELFDKPESRKKRKKKKRINAKDHKKFITEIKEINLNNLNLDMVIEKTQLLVEMRDANLSISDIEVNIKKLETLNDGKIQVQANMGLYSIDKAAEYGKLGINGDAALTLFNSESGDLEPDMEIDLVMSPDSYFTARVPFIHDIWSTVWRSFEVLENAGIRKVRLPDRAEFRDQQKIAMKYKLGKIDLVDSFSVHLSDWEIMMNEGAMFNTGADLHRAEVKIYVAQRVSKVIEALVSKSRQVGKLLDKVIGGSNASLRSKENWVDNGRVFLLLESSGELSKPRLKAKNSILAPLQSKVESLLEKEDEIRDAGKKAKKLFDKIF